MKVEAASLWCSIRNALSHIGKDKNDVHTVTLLKELKSLLRLRAACRRPTNPENLTALGKKYVEQRLQSTKSVWCSAKAYREYPKNKHKKLPKKTNCKKPQQSNTKNTDYKTTTQQITKTLFETKWGYYRILFCLVLHSFCLKHFFYVFGCFWYFVSFGILVLCLFGIFSKPLSAWSEQIEGFRQKPL